MESQQSKESKELFNTLEELNKTADRITHHLNEFEYQYRVYRELNLSRRLSENQTLEIN